MRGWAPRDSLSQTVTFPAHVGAEKDKSAAAEEAAGRAEEESDGGHDSPAQTLKVQMVSSSPQEDCGHSARYYLHTLKANITSRPQLTVI